MSVKPEGLFCAAGHHFDRNKGGFWNLTQPQDKKSLTPGDCDEAVLARHRWIERGHMHGSEGLVGAIAPWLQNASDEANVADLGCGEGSFGPALFPTRAANFCGIDLSRRALKLAAKNWPQATWVLANADRKLPLADGRVDIIVSLFGRRPVSEIARCLTADGICIVAVPGEDDLIELRETVQQQGILKSRWQKIADEFAAEGLACHQQKNWTRTVELDPAAITDALTMTYRAVRKSQNERLADIEKMPVTLAADLMLFKKVASTEVI